MDVIQTFKQISTIPHCSFDTVKLRDYLVNEAKFNGFSVILDEFDNILCKKGSPKICLQAHYDMVCVGNAPNIEIIEDKGFLKAKNSSLGADDGIGVAICLEMMKKFNNLEILFTNNEEVGLIGANGFKGEIKSQNLLNLDSEDDEFIIIGCAGGIDIIASISAKIDANFSENEPKGVFYELSVGDLPGGHSGIDIINNIPNAVKLICKFITQNKCKISHINAGERINSIPANAKAVVWAPNELIDSDIVKVKKLENSPKFSVLSNSDKILNLANSFAQGIRSYDESIASVISSVNLSYIKQDENEVKVAFFARSMKDDELDNLVFEIQTLCESYGYELKFCTHNRAWEAKISEFSNLVLGELKKFNPNASYQATHGGLECGVLSEKFPHLSVCSIGINIFNPHSMSERCEINSAKKTCEVVANIVQKLQ